MTYTNGAGTIREFEAAQYSNPEGLGEDEWELPEAGLEALGEEEWETHETHYSNPYAQEAGLESLGEDEWELPEAGMEALGEEEWETHETHYSNPYAQEAGLESLGEEEWETHETHYSNPYAQETGESDQFLPFLLPLAAKALPLIGKIALPAVKKLLPIGKKLVGNVVKNVMGNLGGGSGPRPRPAGRRMGQPSRARPAGRPTPAGDRSAMIRQLLQQLGGMLQQGEQEASSLEAQLFGANEFEGELAGNETAHEAALTEVLAAEAAHTTNESEAESLLSASLPITIRIMGARRALRPVMPTLVQANTRLVRGLRQGGPAGRQLTRVVPSIQRRTIASLRAMSRTGQPITPSTVARVMAAQSARVLGTPRICGRALVRNTAVRQGTVAPAGQPIRRPRTAEY